MCKWLNKYYFSILLSIYTTEPESVGLIQRQVDQGRGINNLLSLS